VGKAWPSFRFQSVEEGKSTLTPEGLKGHVVILHFWATWSATSEAIHKHLDILHSAFKNETLRIVAVAADDEKAVRMFLTVHPVRFTNCIDLDNQVPNLIGSVNLPTTYLIDSAGLVRWCGPAMALKETALREFITTGKVPQPSGLNPQSIRAEPVTFIKISASREKQPLQGAQISGGGRSPVIEVQLQSETPASIMRLLENVSSMRLIVEPSIPATLYDIEYFQATTNGGSASMMPLVAAFCAQLDLKRSEALEERTVWVATKNDVKLKPVILESGAIGGVGPDGKGRYACRCAALADVFKAMEDRFSELIEDETGLLDHYDISWGMNDDFGAVRARLDREYGILLTRQVRPTRIIRLEKAGSE